MPVREYLDQINCSGKTHPRGGQQYFLGLGLELHKERGREGEERRIVPLCCGRGDTIQRLGRVLDSWWKHRQDTRNSS